MRFTLLAGAIAVPLTWLVPASAREPSDLADSSIVESGHNLALYLCSTCHEVDPTRGSPPALINPAPSFYAIANAVPSTTASLRKFLDTTHGDVTKRPLQMPDVKITDAQKDAAVAYIMSLRNTP